VKWWCRRGTRLKKEVSAAGRTCLGWGKWPRRSRHRTDPPKHVADRRPERQIGFDQLDLSGVSGLEKVAVDGNHQLLQNSHVLDHVVGLQYGHHLGQCHVNGSRDGFQIGENKIHVDRLKEVVAADKEQYANEGVESVGTCGVGVVSRGPQPHDLQY
jgi:hypothetical protein